MTATTTATLADLLADLHRPGEHVAVCHAAPGGRFTARVVPAEDAARVAADLPATVNVWYSANPVSPRTTGRGTADDVTRWAALYADLDVKPGALPDLDAGHAVITDLAVMLGTEPTYVTHSGHGLQPVWLLDAEDDDTHLDTDAKRTRAQALLRRWGRLVARVTADRGSGDVDSVYDLPRVLRAPGSVNVKYPERPVPVTCEARGGRPLTVAEVAETLAAYGVTELPEDTESVGAVVAPPAAWTFSDRTCPWVAAMVRGWQTDTPKGRHPWLTGMAVKLAAAHRAGCITETDYRAAWDTLAARFRQLIATTEPVRREAPREVADAAAWGIRKAASLSAERVAAELGGHRHAVSLDLPVAILDAPADGRESEGNARGNGRESASARLCRIAQERYTFGRATTGEPYALPVTGPRIVHMLRGGPTSLRAELAAAYLAEYGTPPTQQALADALTALEGICMAADPVRLWLRTAEADGALWLDLGDDTGRVIRVHPGGWEVTDTAPVLHQRTALTAAMPTPDRGGDLAALWRLLNVAERDRPMLLGFMVAALLPDIPHPVLSLAGEQGTGKSTAARIIGTTLDPSTVPLRKAPRDLDAWTTAAAGSHVVAVDNLSGLPEWLSDALCRASTGDGDVRRRLYTDGDLFVSSFRRVVIVNGIDLGTVRDDLADRLVTVELDRIGEDRRQRDGDLSARWQAAAPGILGALLDLTAEVLAVLPSVRLDRAPRMADFAHVLAALDRVRGTNALGRYRELSGELAADAVSSDPVLAALTATVTGPWSGATAELLPMLDATRGESRAPRDWPRSARSLSGVLKRRAPSLRRVGWTVEQTDERNERGQVWRLVPPHGGGGHPDEHPDEILTNADERPDEPVSSAVRQPVRQPQTATLTSANTETAEIPDELTNETPNLSLSVQGRGERGPGHDDMREVAVSSSFRQSVRRGGRPECDRHPGTPVSDDLGCPDCGRPLDQEPLPACGCKDLHEPDVAA